MGSRDPGIPPGDGRPRETGDRETGDREIVSTLVNGDRTIPVGSQWDPCGTYTGYTMLNLNSGTRNLIKIQSLSYFRIS